MWGETIYFMTKELIYGKSIDLPELSAKHRRGV